MNKFPLNFRARAHARKLAGITAVPIHLRY